MEATEENINAAEGLGAAAGDDAATGHSVEDRFGADRVAAANSPGRELGPRAAVDLPKTRRLCTECVRLLPIDGAAVSVRGGLSDTELLYATDPVVNRLTDLQFVLGEGPCRDAFRLRVPVLEGDLGSDEAAQRWPGFAREAVAAGAAAVFAFPMQIGAVPFGEVEFYRAAAGGLGSTDLADALALIDNAALAVLDDLVVGLSPAVAEEHRIFGPAEVAQATGMIAVQQGTTVPHALAALRARAFAQNRPVVGVARDVLAGRITFRPSPP